MTLSIIRSVSNDSVWTDLCNGESYGVLRGLRLEPLPVFQIFWMPLASGDEVPVLTGLNMQGFILTSLSGVVSGVALTFAVRWGLSRFTTVTPMRWGFSVFGG